MLSNNALSPDFPSGAGTESSAGAGGAAGQITGFPGIMPDMGGATGPMTGFPGMMPGVGGAAGPMTGFPGIMPGMGGAAGPMTGFPGMMPGVGGAAGPMTGFPGIMPGVGGATGPMTGFPGMMPGMMGMTAAGGGTTGVMPPQMPSGLPITPGGTVLPVTQEESYIENILRMNLGKVATIYMTFENNSEWNAKIFRGVLEAAGRDHIIIRDPQTGRRFMLLTVNLDYITFDEPLNYALPFGTPPGATPSGLTRPD